MNREHLQSICNAIFGMRQPDDNTSALGFAEGSFFGATQNAPLGELRLGTLNLGVVDARKNLSTKQATQTSFHAEMIIVRKWISTVLNIDNPNSVSPETLVHLFLTRSGLIIVANAPCCKHCDNMLSALGIAHPTSAAELNVAGNVLQQAVAALTDKVDLDILAGEASRFPHAAAASSSSAVAASSSSAVAASSSSAAAASSSSTAAASSSVASVASSSATTGASAGSFANSRPHRLTTEQKAAAAYRAKLGQMMADNTTYMSDIEATWSHAALLSNVSRSAQNPRQTANAGNTGWWNPLTDQVIPNADDAFSQKIPEGPLRT